MQRYGHGGFSGLELVDRDVDDLSLGEFDLVQVNKPKRVNVMLVKDSTPL